MGQQPSRLQHSTSRRTSFRGSLQRKLSSRHKNYSATFNYQEGDELNWDLLNVNQASEEELMTLPGITRNVAVNIINYRKAIGGFKKIEDLALVSGVGATKLEFFRNEITVHFRRKVNHNNSFVNGVSLCSSQNQSLESLPTSDTSSRIPSRHGSIKMINVNTANVFQLMSVRGLNQELAANIVDNREARGPYATLSDLTRVKGMTPTKLSSVRANLCTERRNCHTNNSIRTNGSLGIKAGKKAVTKMRTKSSPIGRDAVANADPILQEVYNLLLRQNNRPLMEDTFDNVRDEKPAFRLAGWNLEKFSIEKSRNPGVQEIVCQTIVENGISLLFVSELVSKDSLNSIISELNEPFICKERGHCSNWKSSVLSLHSSNTNNNVQFLNGLIYDSSHGLRLEDLRYLDLTEFEDNGPSQMPLIAWFHIDSLRFIVACCYLTNAKDNCLSAIDKALKKLCPGDDNVVILEFVSQSNSKEGFNAVSFDGYVEIGTSGVSTCLNSKSQTTRVWLSQQMNPNFTGYWGIVREGLHHLAIPEDWSWGGPASHYCPMWLELFAKGTKTTR